MKTVGKKYHLVLGIALVAVVFAFGVYLPQSRKLKEIDKQARSLCLELDAGAARLQTTKAIYDIVDRSRRKLASFDQAVPRRNRIGSFLESVDRIAHGCGLSDKNVVPLEVLESEKLHCLPIKIEFSGDFNAVYEFLRRVESLPRIARIQQLELARTEESQHELTSSLTMQVYFRPS